MCVKGSEEGRKGRNKIIQSEGLGSLCIKTPRRYTCCLEFAKAVVPCPLALFGSGYFHHPVLMSRPHLGLESFIQCLCSILSVIGDERDGEVVGVAGVMSTEAGRADKQENQLRIQDGGSRMDNLQDPVL